MRRKARSFVMLLTLGVVLACCSVLSVSVNRAAPTLVQESFAYAARPSSPVDEIMRSRETAGASRDDTAWMAAGLFTLSILIIASVLGFLYLGTPFLKQVNRLRSRPRTYRPRTVVQPPSPYPRQPTLPARPDEEGRWY